MLDVIHENGKLYCKDTGIGADCKTGVACCLQMCNSLKSCKCALYVKEEVGCQGCKAANNREFFKDVSWCLGFDSPELNRAAKSCNGTPLFSDKFFEDYLQPICKKHGLTNFKHEPGTDLWLIRKMEMAKDKDGKGLHLETLNIGSGGHNPHQKTEYAMFDEVCKAESTGLDLLKSIPCDRQWLSEVVEPKHQAWGYWGSGNSWGGGSSSYEPFDWSKYYSSKKPKAWSSKSSGKNKFSGQKMPRDSYLPGFDETPDEVYDLDDEGNWYGADDELDGGEVAYRDIDGSPSGEVKFSDEEPDIKTFQDWFNKRVLAKG